MLYHASAVMAPPPPSLSTHRSQPLSAPAHPHPPPPLPPPPLNGSPHQHHHQHHTGGGYLHHETSPVNYHHSSAQLQVSNYLSSTQGSWSAITSSGRPAMQYNS